MSPVPYACGLPQESAAPACPEQGKRCPKHSMLTAMHTCARLMGQMLEDVEGKLREIRTTRDADSRRYCSWHCHQCLWLG